MPVPFPYAGYSEDIVRRVRVLFGGKFIVDSEKPRLVWEHPNYPIYYFPKSDVLTENLRQSSGSVEDKEKEIYDLVVGDRVAEKAATLFLAGDFKDFIKINSKKTDAWFEEDEPIYAHPKDPYKRILILPSSKHIRVEIDGVEVANTIKAKRLYETGLPTRSYIPPTDVRLDLFTPSDRITQCPYKGTANYYDVNLPSPSSPSTTIKKEGLVWYYKTPTLESTQITGLISFYDEKVDVWVDGVKQGKPTTQFS